MSTAAKYALDANIFIEAKRRYYAFALCPGFWTALVWHHAQDRLDSIDKIKTELEAGRDELSNWVANAVPAACFASTGETEIVNWYGQVVSWVQAQPQFSPEAKASFAAGVDAWLIAYAKATGRVLVTHEVLAPDARRKVPIPNVCAAFAVPCADTFAMLQDLGVQFNWDPPAS